MLRRRGLPCLDLLISKWRLWPQLRLTLPVPVRPKRFLAPLLVLSLGIFHPWIGLGGEACPSGAPVHRNGGRGQPPVEAARYSGAGAVAQAGHAALPGKSRPGSAAI